MARPTPSVHIALYGPEETAVHGSRGCRLWDPGYASAVTASEATPVRLGETIGDRTWRSALDGIDGVVLTGTGRSGAHPRAEEERLCQWCRKHRLPLLAIDHGMHLLNLTFGGSIHLDLPRELPEALQHRHPPEPGLRHAIAVEENTHLARLYGEGEIVVNSEHSRAVERMARGFRVSARALDGVIEAIEGEDDDWFVLGVQWRPASASASGLDIQLFRGLVDACHAKVGNRKLVACGSAA